MRGDKVTGMEVIERESEKIECRVFWDLNLELRFPTGYIKTTLNANRAWHKRKRWPDV